MKAVILTEPGRIEVTETWPEPECGPDEVIVRIAGVGLCGSDLSIYDGKVTPPSSPWVMGHEGGGDIVAVGSDVRDRHVGQRVVIEPNAGCGVCAACLAGRTTLCKNRVSMGFSRSGLLAERVAVRADYAWVVPDDTPAVTIACFEPMVVADMAVKRAGVTTGSECLVMGAGSVGQLVCQAVIAAGGTASVIELHPGRLELAESLGARPTTAAEDVYPFVFETTGAPAVWQDAYDSVDAGGILTVIGFNREPVSFVPVELIGRQLTIRGHRTYDHPGDFAATREAVLAGSLVPEAAVRASFPVERTAEAFAAVREVPGKTWVDFSAWLQD